MSRLDEAIENAKKLLQVNSGQVLPFCVSDQKVPWVWSARVLTRSQA